MSVLQSYVFILPFILPLIFNQLTTQSGELTLIGGVLENSTGPSKRALYQTTIKSISTSPWLRSSWPSVRSPSRPFSSSVRHQRVPSEFWQPLYPSIHHFNTSRYFHPLSIYSQSTDLLPLTLTNTLDLLNLFTLFTRSKPVNQSQPSSTQILYISNKINTPTRWPITWQPITIKNNSAAINKEWSQTSLDALLITIQLQKI